MRIPIEPSDSTDGTFSELLKLQADFYARLTEETMRYLRRLQGAAAPAAPGTVLMPGKMTELSASGSRGASTEFVLEIENRQRVHCVVTPMLSPLVSSSGVTWFPAAEPEPHSLLVAPSEVATLVIKLPLPASLTPGTYTGALLLEGVRQGTIAVTVNVIAPETGGEPEATVQAQAVDQEQTPQAEKTPVRKRPSKRGSKGAASKRTASKSRARGGRRPS